MAIDDEFEDVALEDDGVLEPADSLLTDDLRDDPLDTGLTTAENWSAGQRYGSTEAEAAQGESLDRLLAAEESEPDPARVGGRWDAAEPRSGRLVVEEGDRSGELFGRDMGVDGGAASAEEAAMHLTEEDADRAAQFDDPLDETLDEAIANMVADEARDAGAGSYDD